VLANRFGRRYSRTGVWVSSVRYSVSSADVIPGRERLVDQAYRQIRDAIVAVRLQPGAPLDEKALSASLGLGLTPVGTTPEQMSALIKEESMQVAKLVKQIGLQPQ